MIGKIYDTMFKCYKKALTFLPIKKVVVFESNPEFSCNTYPVYRYLIDEKHIDDKYKIVWFVADPGKYKNSDLKNTSFIKYGDPSNSFFEKLKMFYILGTSKCLIYCNRILGKQRKDQYSLCLQHGMPLKKSNGGYCINDNCDECLCVSEFFADNYSEDFKISKEKMIFMGFPRNDYLFTKRDVLSEMGLDGYNKVFIWMPTYRKINNPKVAKFNIETTATGIPTINTVDQIIKVDEWMRKHNCLLILKPHPAQNISVEIQSKLSNFKIITNDDLSKKNIQLYELMGKTDALISDYSSVYYDYLLVDKPIGLTVDDLDSYISARGFVYDNPKDILKGEYINDTDDLLAFFDNVYNGKDLFAAERREVKNKLHKIQTADSAKMIGEHIMSKLEN